MEVFNYASGHTVDEVSKSDYSSCSIGNAINTDNSGSTSVLLKSPGPLFFICGVVGHCGSGMKLSLTVVGVGSQGSSSSSSATNNSTTSNTSSSTTAGSTSSGIPCTTTPSVYGAVGANPFPISESPKSLFSFPAASFVSMASVLLLLDLRVEA